MIYITSFLRRIKLKSALQFALIVHLPFFFFYSPLTLLLSVLVLTIALTLSAHAINAFSLRYTRSNITCRLCQYAHCVLLYPARQTKHQTKKVGSFACTSYDHGHYPDIFYCPRCKNGFLANISKADGEEMYKAVVDTEYLENLPARHLTYRHFLKRYLEEFKNKDVLEIGHYYGAFCDMAQGVVKSYTGIEPSKHASNYLQAKYPHLPLINGTLEEVLESQRLKKEQFDLIVLFDVIEHLPDPLQTLRQLHTLLRPNGKILYSTINIEASFSLLLGPLWPWFMDMHYYYFSDRGYVDLFERSGHVLKRHAHFPYRVSGAYFLRKVFSLLHFDWGLRLIKKISFLERITLPIKLGDTVLVMGEKSDKA